MRRQAGDPVPHRRVAERPLVAGVLEHVGAVGDQAVVQVQPVARDARERLGHERGAQAVLARDLAHDRLEHDRVVGDSDGGPVAEVDLDLRRAVLRVGGLDDDAVLLDHAADLAHDVLELGALLQRVALDAVVDRLARLVREVELDLGRQHGVEAARLAALDLAPQLVARIHVERLVAVLGDAVGHADGRALAPGRRPQRREIGQHDHVDDVRGRVVVRQLGKLAVPTPEEGRVGLREALLGGAVEEVRGGDALAAQMPLRVGERDLDRVDVVLADERLRAGVVLLCAAHAGDDSRVRRLTRNVRGAFSRRRCRARRPSRRRPAARP